MTPAADNMTNVEHRRTDNTVAANVAHAIAASGLTPESVAQATDLTISELHERLNGESPFMFRELVMVGGFLRFPTPQFFEGVSE